MGFPGTTRVRAKVRKRATSSTGTMSRTRRAAYSRSRLAAIPDLPYSLYLTSLFLVHVGVPIELVVVIDVALHVLAHDHVPVGAAEERQRCVIHHQLLSLLARSQPGLLVQREGELVDKGVHLRIRVADVVGRAVGLDDPAHVVPGVVDPGEPLVDPDLKLLALFLLVEWRKGQLLDRDVETQLLQIGLDEDRRALGLFPVRTHREGDSRRSLAFRESARGQKVRSLLEIGVVLPEAEVAGR